MYLTRYSLLLTGRLETIQNLIRIVPSMALKYILQIDLITVIVGSLFKIMMRHL